MQCRRCSPPVWTRLKAPSFQIGSGYEIWPDCSSSKYASIDRVEFSIGRHSFKMAAMTSFHAEKCRRLASKLETSVRAHLYSSVCQFLIYSTFVLVSWRSYRILRFP